MNPFFSLIRFSVGTGFQVIAAHERRHLWQAERVLANPRFPLLRAPAATSRSTRGRAPIAS